MPTDPGPDEFDADLLADGEEDLDCPHCGEAIYPDAEQCPACGTWLTAHDRLAGDEGRGLWPWVVGLLLLGFVLWLLL